MRLRGTGNLDQALYVFNDGKVCPALPSGLSQSEITARMAVMLAITSPGPRSVNLL